MNHAKLGYGGSVAFRTMACPGWIRLAETLPVDYIGGSSPAADAGTLCHMAVEALINRTVLKPASLLGLRFNGVELDEEMLYDLVLPAFDSYQRNQPLDWVERFVEVKVRIATPTLPHINAHGTADMIHVYDDWLNIGDWKFGYRQVTPDCDQLHFYGVGAVETLPQLRGLPLDFPVRLSVWQPRISLEPSHHETTIEGLMLWKMNYIGALVQAERISPPRRLGSHCEFCPARIICPEVRHELPSLIKADPKIMSPSDLAELATVTSGLGNLQDAAMAEVRAALQGGVEVPKWKLIPGNRRREWLDPGKAAEVLADHGIEPRVVKILSVAQAQKQLEKLGVDINDVLGDNIAESRNAPRPVPSNAPGTALPDVSKFAKAFVHVMTVPK